MKLKKFNKANSGNGKSTSPVINIHHKGGFGLNVALLDLLGLKEGGGIELHQNDEDETEWYICKSKDPGAFIIRKNGDSFIFQSSTLANTILKTYEFDYSAKVPVSSEATIVNGEKLYLLIVGDAQGKIFDTEENEKTE